MNDFPRRVAAVDVVNGIFGPDLFSLPDGRARYDSVYMRDGGRALYLARLNPDLTAVRRWIDWETELIQHHNPLEAT